MRNIKLFILTACIAFLSLQVNAQNQKVGFINSAALLQIMPEVTTANAQLETYIKQLDDEANALANEYKRFASELESQLPTMSDLIKETKLKELQDKERRIQEYQYGAQRKVQEKELELMKPIEDKAMDAINAVAERQGFAYVLNSASLVFVGTGSIDILPMVKAQLGIQ